MRQAFLLTGLTLLLLLAACSGRITDPSNPNDPIPGERPDALELTTLGNQADVATLTFLNVEGVNIPEFRKSISVEGIPGDQLYTIDYAPDGTLYGLAVLSVNAESTEAALYTIDPLTGASSEVSPLTLPFEPNDMRFIPDTSTVRITGGGNQVQPEKTTTVDVTSFEVGPVTELTRAAAGGQNLVASAFDYADGVAQAVMSNGVTGYQNYLAVADAEPPTGFIVNDVLLEPGTSYVEAFVQDQAVGYGATMTFEQPEADPRLVTINLTTGTFTELGTFPVSQLALARTPPGVVKALFE